MVLETVSKVFSVLGALLAIGAVYNWIEYWLYGQDALLMSEALMWTLIMILAFAIATGIERISTNNSQTA